MTNGREYTGRERIFVNMYYKIIEIAKTLNLTKWKVKSKHQRYSAKHYVNNIYKKCCVQ